MNAENLPPIPETTEPPHAPQGPAGSWVSRHAGLVALLSLLVLGLVALVCQALPDDKPQKSRKPVAGKTLKKKKAKKKVKAPAEAPAVVPAVAPAPVAQPAPPVAQPEKAVEWTPEVGVTYIFEWGSVAEAPRLFDELPDLVACKVKGLDSPQSREYFRALVRRRKAGYLPMEAKVLEADGTFCRVCTPSGITGWVAVEDLRRTQPRPVNP